MLKATSIKNTSNKIHHVAHVILCDYIILKILIWQFLPKEARA